KDTARLAGLAERRQDGKMRLRGEGKRASRTLGQAIGPLGDSREIDRVRQDRGPIRRDSLAIDDVVAGAVGDRDIAADLREAGWALQDRAPAVADMDRRR